MLRFFKKRRGLMFALRTIPWHWFYYLYSGLAFSIGFLDYQVKRVMRRRIAHRVPESLRADKETKVSVQ